MCDAGEWARMEWWKKRANTGLKEWVRCRVRTKKDYELKGVSYDACGRRRMGASERAGRHRMGDAGEWVLEKQTGEGA